MTDKELHEANEFGNEEDKGEDEESEEGMANDFTDNIAIQDAHGAKGECNMRMREEWFVMEF
jgi:hypothetical protein